MEKSGEQNKRHATKLTLDTKWGVLVAIGTGTFMSALDISVVNTVLPVINQNFQSHIATVEWVVIIYLLLVSGMLPGFGRLGDIRGHKPVYIAGFAVFIGSSLLCGLSPSIYALIAARAVQSLGAAMLSANSPAILTKTFPSFERGKALGLQATMTYLGLIAGPSFGGWLTESLGWRSVFYINLPVGLAALLLSLRFIPKDDTKSSREPFDWSGAFLFLSGLIALLLGLNRGYEWGWTSPTILALILGAFLLLSIFIIVERAKSAPMLDLSLFQNRSFAATISSAILNYICVYSIIFLLPFYLIVGRSLTPAQAGLILTAQPIVMAVVAPISGTLSDSIGSRIPGVVGMGVLAGGLFLLSKLSLSTPMATIALSLSVVGLGIGIFISPNNSALMGSAPYNRQGIAAGLLATARNVGMVLGVGLAGAIFTTVTSISSPDNPENVIRAIQISFQFIIMVALAGMFTASIRSSNYST